VGPWSRDTVSERQKLVKRCLMTLRHNDFHILSDGTRREITARDYLRELRQFSFNTDTRGPCSTSHRNILPRLKLKMSFSDARFFTEAVNHTPSMSGMISSLAATLLRRATFRATSFLSSQGRPQSQDGHLFSLGPIMEDSGSSLEKLQSHTLLMTWI
jgi:hypothetical protein